MSVNTNQRSSHMAPLSKETQREDYAIHVRGLNKYFKDKHVVRDVSIAVKRGHVTGFLGPNGSGKTTTLRLLCGLLTPDSGEGEVLGMDFRARSKEIKLKTGYMTQKFSLYDDMTIEENLRFAARIYGMTPIDQCVKNALDRLNLYDRREQLVKALSGGWKQRLALAVCTLHKPDLLLLDEPTAGVDPQARREFWDEIHKLSAEGLTVLVSTHYMDEAERCHDIGYILYGRLIERGTGEEIISRSKLITFECEGKDTGAIAHQLAKRDGVLSASAFGNSLHVGGLDRGALERAIAPYRTSFAWKESPPSLEDVFIHFMNNQKDDRYSS